MGYDYHANRQNFGFYPDYRGGDGKQDFDDLVREVGELRGVKQSYGDCTVNQMTNSLDGYDNSHFYVVIFIDQPPPVPEE